MKGRGKYFPIIMDELRQAGYEVVDNNTSHFHLRNKTGHRITLPQRFDGIGAYKKTRQAIKVTS